MVSTGTKTQQNRRLLSQLYDFIQGVITDDALKSRKQNVVVNSGSIYQEFPVSNTDSIPAVNEITMNAKALERCLPGRIDKEMGNIIETVEDRIQNAILTANDNNITPRIELAVR